MDKEELLEGICVYYNYDLKLKNGRVEISNGVSEPMVYISIEKALKDWLSTLVTTNKDIYEDTGEGCGEYNTWSKEAIDFIKGI